MDRVGAAASLVANATEVKAYMYQQYSMLSHCASTKWNEMKCEAAQARFHGAEVREVSDQRKHLARRTYADAFVVRQLSVPLLLGVFEGS